MPSDKFQWKTDDLVFDEPVEKSHLRVIHYASDQDLPESVRNKIPDAIGQTVFRQALNDALANGKSEMHGFLAGYKALASAGYAEDESGDWVVKQGGPGGIGLPGEPDPNSEDYTSRPQVLNTDDVEISEYLAHLEDLAKSSPTLQQSHVNRPMGDIEEKDDPGTEELNTPDVVYYADRPQDQGDDEVDQEKEDDPGTQFANPEQVAVLGADIQNPFDSRDENDGVMTLDKGGPGSGPRGTSGLLHNAVGARVVVHKPGSPFHGQEGTILRQQGNEHAVDFKGGKVEWLNSNDLLRKADELEEKDDPGGETMDYQEPDYAEVPNYAAITSFQGSGNQDPENIYEKGGPGSGPHGGSGHQVPLGGHQGQGWINPKSGQYTPLQSHEEHSDAAQRLGFSSRKEALNGGFIRHISQGDRSLFEFKALPQTIKQVRDNLSALHPESKVTLDVYTDTHVKGTPNISYSGSPKQADYRLNSVGKSDVEKRISGSSDISLNKEGEALAAKLGVRIADKGGFDILYSSPLARGKETAHEILEACPHTTYAAPNAALQPWHLGEFEGQSGKDVSDDISHYVDNPDERPPGEGADDKPAETFNESKERQLTFWKDLYDDWSNDPTLKIGVICHSRGLQLLQAWIDAGCPKDFDLDKDDIHDPDNEPHASVYRWHKDDIKEIDLDDDDPLKPGVYPILHSLTDDDTDEGNDDLKKGGPGSGPHGQLQSLQARHDQLKDHPGRTYQPHEAAANNFVKGVDELNQQTQAFSNKNAGMLMNARALMKSQLAVSQEHVNNAYRQKNTEKMVSYADQGLMGVHNALRAASKAMGSKWVGKAESHLDLDEQLEKGGPGSGPHKQLTSLQTQHDQLKEHPANRFQPHESTVNNFVKGLEDLHQQTSNFASKNGKSWAPNVKARVQDSLDEAMDHLNRTHEQSSPAEKAGYANRALMNIHDALRSVTRTMNSKWVSKAESHLDLDEQLEKGGPGSGPQGGKVTYRVTDKGSHHYVAAYSPDHHGGVTGLSPAHDARTMLAINHPKGFSSDNMIAHAEIIHDRQHGNYADYTVVHPNFQRQGIASKMYDLSEKHTGNKVVPSSNQTEDAKGFWSTRKYLPPIEVQKAAKAAYDLGSSVIDITYPLSEGTGLTEDGIREVAKHFDAVESVTDSETTRNAWGGPLAGKWAQRVIRKINRDYPGWIGVDLDGTLAKPLESYGDGTEIGDPIQGPFFDKVKQAVSEGKPIRILTARVAHDPTGKVARSIQAWTKKYLGKELPVTNEKDPGMSEIWDDRAHSPNEITKEDGLGVMIGLRLPLNVAEELYVQDGEDPEDMHITMVYLGKNVPEEKLDDLKVMLKGFASTFAPISVTISGPLRFPATPQSDNLDVCVASVESKALHALREDLLSKVESLGIDVKKTFAYTPHVTLKYMNPNDHLPVQRVDPLKVKFDSITLYVSKKTTEFPLSGTAIAKEDDCYQGNGTIIEVVSDGSTLWAHVSQDDGSRIAISFESNAPIQVGDYIRWSNAEASVDGTQYPVVSISKGTGSKEGQWITVNGQHIFVDSNGNPLSGNPKVLGQRKVSAKVERARNNAVLTGKHEQDIADKGEKKLSAALGIPRTKNNSAFDLRNDSVGIEVKTMTHGKNDKITMSKAALGRKLAEQRAEGLKVYTVVADMRNRTAAKYYVKEGVGSFRVGSMNPITLPQLKELVTR